MRVREATGLLGLARRAGAVEAGTSAVRKALRTGRAHLVLVAADAAEGQRRKLVGLLARGSVPVRVYGDRAALGAAIGTAPVSALAVTDPALAAPLLEVLPVAGPESVGREAAREVQRR